MVLIIGFEGSANKIGVGIIKDGVVLANPRQTFISPPGEGLTHLLWKISSGKKIYISLNPKLGFMPSEIAKHHKVHILGVTKQALEEAKIKPSEIDAIAFTKGPGMGGKRIYQIFLIIKLILIYLKKKIHY